jgi:hypothetical protein
MLTASQTRSIIKGVLILVAVTALLMGVQMARFLPGFAGECFAMLAGFLTTPFIMEASLVIGGFVAVIMINDYRRSREGDEFVYLDEIKDPPPGLPDHAKFAIYKEKPLPGEQPSPLDQLEGAIAAEDDASATEILATFTDDQLAMPEVLRLRLLLAEQTGKTELAQKLRVQLDG